MAYKPVIYDHSDQEINPGIVAPTFLKESEIKKLDRHLETNIGKTATVFHELISSIVHADIYMVEPTPDRDFYTLVTLGMSALPMHTPYKDRQYIELMISLPKTWKLSQADFDDENNYWPVRLLKSLSRFPFEYETWLGYGHTIPNGNPAQPFSNICGFNGVLLLPSLLFPKAWECKTSLFKKVHFYTLHPLYNDEMEFKVQNGVDSLLDKFDAHNFSEIVDINRKEISFG